MSRASKSPRAASPIYAPSHLRSTSSARPPPAARRPPPPPPCLPPRHSMLLKSSYAEPSVQCGGQDGFASTQRPPPSRHRHVSIHVPRPKHPCRPAPHIPLAPGAQRARLAHSPTRPHHHQPYGTPYGHNAPRPPHPPAHHPHPCLKCLGTLPFKAQCPVQGMHHVPAYATHRNPPLPSYHPC